MSRPSGMRCLHSRIEDITAWASTVNPKSVVESDTFSLYLLSRKAEETIRKKDVKTIEHQHIITSFKMV